VVSVLAIAAACLVMPAAAAAHGPADPAASRWQARVTYVPAGLHAETVDGDLRLWLRAGRAITAEVLDYRGAPYLRFTPAGVFVNTNSSMWYINHVPRLTPPISLGPRTPPHWEHVSSGHAYLWQDGRLQALSRTVLAPGSRDAGRWSIPVTVNGHPDRIAGRLYHWPDPSIVWFWPIVVAVLCMLAGLRLRRPELDWRMAMGLGFVALAGFAVASVGRQLHGRPGVSVGQLIALAIELAYCGWALSWLARRRAGWLTFFVIAVAALWQGISLVEALAEGDVLLATGPLLGRLGVVACLSAGAALAPIAIVMADRDTPVRRRMATSVSGERRPEGDASPSALATPRT
jgi:hypothetical protein